MVCLRGRTRQLLGWSLPRRWLLGALLSTSTLGMLKWSYLDLYLKASSAGLTVVLGGLGFRVEGFGFLCMYCSCRASICCNTLRPPKQDFFLGHAMLYTKAYTQGTPPGGVWGISAALLTENSSAFQLFASDRLFAQPMVSLELYYNLVEAHTFQSGFRD